MFQCKLQLVFGAFDSLFSLLMYGLETVILTEMHCKTIFHFVSYILTYITYINHGLWNKLLLTWELLHIRSYVEMSLFSPDINWSNILCWKHIHLVSLSFSSWDNLIRLFQLTSSNVVQIFHQVSFYTVYFVALSSLWWWKKK